MAKDNKLFTLLNHLNMEFEDKWIEFETTYNSFMVNRFFSMNKETVHFANEMNKTRLPKREQYLFYLNVIPKKRRFLKYNSKINDEEVKLIADYHKCSISTAKRYHTLLTAENINNIKQKLTEQNWYG